MVTSRDFGGVAQLRATASVQTAQQAGKTLGVTTYDVDIVDDMITQGPVPPPSGSCGVDFAAHQFASLPVDQDCNGIADSWEEQYTTPTGGHLDPTADSEPGYLPTSPKGDGWSVHDEYRGFHYVADDGVTVHWVATDPVTKLDIFFWDGGFTPPADGLGSNIPANPNLYTQALRGMLCLQGNSMEMGYGATFPVVPPFPAVAPVPASPTGLNVGSPYCSAGLNEMGPNKTPNPLRYLYRRVNAQQAQMEKPGDATAGVKWFNINSLTASVTQGNHTVVVYNSKPTDPSQPDETVLGITHNYLDQTPSLFARIDFNYPAIIQGLIAARVGNVASRLAQTLAHETGHWFGELHPARTVTYQVFPTPLPWGFYEFPDNTLLFSPTILVGLQQTTEPGLPTPQPGCPGGMPDPCPVYIRQREWAEHVRYPGVGSGIFQTLNALGVTVAAVPFTNVKAGKTLPYTVETMQNEIMDWRANHTLTSPAQWHFDLANLNTFCGKNPCQ